MTSDDLRRRKRIQGEGNAVKGGIGSIGRSDDDRRLRRVFALLAVTSGILVFYASLLPMRFQSRTFAEAWEIFRRVPWKDLPLGKRADWVSNGLVMVPLGFFVAASLHWKRPSMARKQASLLVFAVLHGVFICVIEFAQTWFPPRVLSINDMLAGYLGGLAGVLLWHVAGPRIVNTVLAFVRAPRGFPRVLILAHCGALALVLYNLMPLDVILSPAEWEKKIAAGHVIWIPFADWSTIQAALKSILLSSWAFPLGVTLGIAYPRRTAIHCVLLWCLAIELASLPIFHRESSITDLLVSSSLGCVGVGLQAQVRRWWGRLDRWQIWGIAAIAWSILAMVGFTARGSRVATGQELTNRLWSMLAFPFARAQRSTEVAAAQNFLFKMAIFALLAFLISGAISRLSQQAAKERRPGLRLLLCMLWVFVLGIAIEVAQAYLPPEIPDVSDLVLYCMGGVLGAFGFTLLVPATAEIDCGASAS